MEELLKNIKCTAFNIKNSDIKNITLVSDDETCEEAVDVLNSNGYNIEKIIKLSEKNFFITLFKSKNLTVYLKDFYQGQKEYSFLKNNKFCKKFYYFPSDSVEKTLSDQKPNESVIKILETHNKELKKALELLSDSASKKAYLSLLKTIFKNDIGYLEISSYPEKFHKKVMPKNGDLIIDAGISRYTNTLKKLSEIATTTGKIIAFEPSSVEFEKIKEQTNLFKINNITLLNKGLWNENCCLNLSNQNHSSSVKKTTPNTEKAEFVSLDSFVDKNDIKKIDFIKLHIEGSEKEAIVGMKKALKKFKPKLVISLDHSPLDLFKIIIYINNLNTGYKMYIGHHSSFIEGTWLYATV